MGKLDKSDLAPILDRAEALAWQYEQRHGGCAQVVLAAIKETVDCVGDDVFQAATGMAGGLGRCGYACGALTGGTMALSCFWGRPYDDFADPNGRRARTLEMCRKLVRRFEKEYGSPNCREIHVKIMGRAYDLGDAEEFKSFIAAGGHDDKCPSVCRNAARWVIEILNDEGLLEPARFVLK